MKSDGYFIAMLIGTLRVLGVLSEEEQGTSLILYLTIAGLWQKAAVVPHSPSLHRKPTPAPSPKSWVGLMTAHCCLVIGKPLGTAVQGRPPLEHCFLAFMENPVLHYNYLF